MWVASLLKRMDRTAVLGVDVWEFSALSLSHAYGRLFLRRILLGYPWRVLTGLWAYARRVRPNRRTDLAPVGVGTDEEAWVKELAEHDWLVGMGFCQKEMACPAGRFNHRCLVLERWDAGEMPSVCAACPVRAVALLALPAGAGLHLMTSAEDIAHDLLLPGLRGELPGRLVLVVCPYSVAPLSVAMAIAGLRGWLLAYHLGDCRDYATWLQADRGTKPEQTFLPATAQERLRQLLERVARARAALGRPDARTYRSVGNRYAPVA